MHFEDKIIQKDSLLYLCSFYPDVFMKIAFGIDPDRWQNKVLTEKPVKTLLLCSRQSGKSTVCATLALHRASFIDNSLILVLSNTFRQAEETFRKIKKGLPFICEYREVVYETQTMLEMSNGSRIVALPAKQESIRSFSSVSLLIVDEASQVQDEVYKTVRPMLAVSQGDIIALSTPFGKRGWFYESWVGGEGWKRYKVTAEDCPRISKEFIDDEIKEIGIWWVNQEYFCEFVDAEDQIFGHDDVIDSIDSNLETISLGPTDNVHLSHIRNI